MSGGLVGRAPLVLLLWLLGGRVGLFVGLAIVLVDVAFRPSARLLMQASLLGFCLLPLAVVLRGLPTPSTVTPLFAGSNLVAHYLAGTALALLVLGILRDVRPAPRLDGPANGPPPSGYELPAPLPTATVAERLPAPGDTGTAGNGAREAQPALPSAVHPPLWDPARRSAGTAAAPPKEAPAIHPPLWDPARRPARGAGAAGGPAGPPQEAPPTHPPLRAPGPGNADSPAGPPQDAPATHPPLKAPGRGPRPTGPAAPTGPGGGDVGEGQPPEEASSQPARRRSISEPVDRDAEQRVPGRPATPSDRTSGEAAGPGGEDPADGPATAPSDQADDRPGREGRRHPPELRIAGGPPGTEGGRDGPEPQEGEQGRDGPEPQEGEQGPER